MARRKRPRAAGTGKYARRTVSIPPEDMARFEKYLETRKDLTLSALLTQAGVAFIEAAERGQGAR